MKEGAIDCERAIVTHHQATEVAEPGVSAFDDPMPLVTSQRATVLGRRFLPVRAMRGNQFDASSCQPLPQRNTVVGLVGDHPHGLLSRPTRAMTATYADRRECGFREPDFRRGCRVKVVSQRKTAAVDHHDPLRPLAPLGFSDSAASFFFRGSKTPVQKRLAPLQLLALVQFAQKRPPDSHPDALLLPIPQPSPAGRGMRILLPALAKAIWPRPSGRRSSARAIG